MILTVTVLVFTDSTCVATSNGLYAVSQK